MTRTKLLHFFSGFLVLLFLLSCGEKSKMPLWEISKLNSPKSYLVGTVNNLKSNGNEELINKVVQEKFDNASAFITQIDIINSDFILSKNQVEIGMNKTLKDILSETDFSTLSALRDDWVQIKKNQYEAPDSVKIKLLFYLQDALFQNDGKNLFFEQIWMQQAMATKKKILGFETYQKHYKDLAQITLPEQIEFMNSIKNVEKFKTEFNDAVVDYYFSGEYEKIYTEHLNKFNYNKTNYGNLWVKKHRDWATTSAPILDSQSCFISLEVQHLFGKENFIDNLLSKGYKVKKIQ